MAPKWHKDRCCNPFQIQRHLRKESLRYISESCIKKMPFLSKTHLVCSSCRNRIENMPVKDHKSDQCIPTSDSNSSQEVDLITPQVSDVSINTSLSVVNKALQLMHQSPIPRKKLKLTNSQWATRKVENVANSLKQALGVPETCETNNSLQTTSEMFFQAREKFHSPNTSRDTKIQLLTLLPKSWSIPMIVQQMEATYYMAKQAKKLVEQHGILARPSKKKGKPLNPEVISKIVKFYEDDEMSSLMPGKKDFVSIKCTHGEKQRIHKQKRLILSNLKELYMAFKEMNNGLNVGFSKFSSLRPLHYVLAGASGTHTVCVCSMHENMKLMIQASNLPSLTRGLDYLIKSYADVLLLLTCDDERPECCLDNCKNCPGTKNLYQFIHRTLTDSGVRDIEYEQWVSKPRTTLESTTSSVLEFVEKFCNQAKLLLTHSFIAQQQSCSLKWSKDNLKQGECVAICDFAENYAFVIQKAAPGFHWNNNQATIYPVVLYYNNGNGLEHKSLVIVSDCLKHDAIAVYTFSIANNYFVKEFIDHPTKVIYFSDGAPQQFKNYKHFSNVYYHEEDFGVPAEWHFFATAHGKGPCDGVGETVKRLAARASLQLPADKQITTPRQLYEWAYHNIPGIAMRWSDSANYERAKNILSMGDCRFNEAKSIPCTQKKHCLVPAANENVLMKRYSFATEDEIHSLINKQ